MSFFANFVLFGLDEAGRERGAFLVAQFDAVFGLVSGGLRFFEFFDFL